MPRTYAYKEAISSFTALTSERALLSLKGNLAALIVTRQRALSKNKNSTIFRSFRIDALDFFKGFIIYLRICLTL